MRKKMNGGMTHDDGHNHYHHQQQRDHEADVEFLCWDDQLPESPAEASAASLNTPHVHVIVRQQQRIPAPISVLALTGVPLKYFHAPSRRSNHVAHHHSAATYASASAYAAAAAAINWSANHFQMAPLDTTAAGADAAPITSACVSNKDSRVYHAYLDQQFRWKYHLQMQYHTLYSLCKQQEVDTGKRAELVQWLAKVSRQFKYEMETFLLTVNYVDRFLVTTPLAFSCLQLLGVAALLVASKKEEVCQPSIQEMLSLCGGKYKSDEVKKMEMILLHKLGFRLCAPTASDFFEYYMTLVNGIDIKSFRQAVHCLLELCIANYELSQYLPSTLAASAILMTQLSIPQPLHLRHLPEMFPAAEKNNILHCFTHMQSVASFDSAWLRIVQRQSGNKFAKEIAAAAAAGVSSANFKRQSALCYAPR